MVTSDLASWSLYVPSELPGLLSAIEDEGRANTVRARADGFFGTESGGRARYFDCRSISPTPLPRGVLEEFPAWQ